MANRHLARSIVLQTLFEWDFNGRKSSDLSEELLHNTSEFGPGLSVDSFMETLLKIVLDKQESIDEIITRAAPEWPLEKISMVDRNVLRIGLAELLFADKNEVPPKVAINEAIELAKTFGGEKSGKFVNGVLGAVYKEMGEPGKEDSGKKKVKEVKLEDMPVEKKAGGVIVSEKDGQFYFGLVHDVFGYWTLAKGGVEDGETSEEGAIREIKEKTDLDAEIVKLLGENEYVASHPEKGKIRKQVSYYLVKSPFVEMNVKTNGGLDGGKWFTLAELEDIKTYDDILPLLAQSVEYITK
ncbi:MAG: Transcription antitermination protein NusB [Patescibacteria group bacterium]|jgi:N utilization substance protein B|nr:Transcription antitermination protein NusB [Patescibacteria group bacterium]